MTHSLPKGALRAPRKPGRKRKKRKHRAWLMWWQYLAYLLLRALLRRISLRAAYRLAESLVLCVVYFSRKHRQRGLASLQIAFGERPLAWRRRIFWASIRQLAYVAIETVLQPDLVPDPARREAFDMSALAACLEEVGLYQKSGALLLSSHQGNSDLLATVCGERGWVIGVAARTIDNPHVNALIVADRERLGRDIIDKKGFLKPALRRLKSNGLIALLIDQDMGSHGLFVPYFGVLASTTGGGAYLALRTGQPVFMSFFIRKRPRCLDHVAYCERLHYEPTGDRTTDIEQLTALATLEIEKFARRFPEQVLWAHRRWKSRPPTEAI